MNQLATNKPPKDHIPGCAEAMRAAEQELTAFFRAVVNLFGSELAELSADAWLNELMTTESLPSSTREWRGITLKASTRLALGVNASAITGIHAGHSHPHVHRYSRS
jgi:alkylhydroperoxidase/carboxymuconolactone decarboxylase family protein YurZ